MQAMRVRYKDFFVFLYIFFLAGAILFLWSRLTVVSKLADLNGEKIESNNIATRAELNRLTETIFTGITNSEKLVLSMSMENLSNEEILDTIDKSFRLDYPPVLVIHNDSVGYVDMSALVGKSGYDKKKYTTAIDKVAKKYGVALFVSPVIVSKSGVVDYTDEVISALE